MDMDDLIDRLRANGDRLSQAQESAIRGFFRTPPEARDTDWHPHTEEPKVSAWQWLDYWSTDGVPGIMRFEVGDRMTTYDGVAWWRYRSLPQNRSEGE